MASHMKCRLPVRWATDAGILHPTGLARVPKAYPIYDATYPQNIRIIREYLDKFKNLQPIGRYGMFKYNNMDHSILTGIYAADNILGSKKDIWKVNCDDDYHEKN